MSVHNNSESIYNLTIDSLEDLEKALYYSNQDHEKISKITKFYRIVNISEHLNLSCSFKAAYQGSLCFKASSDVVRDMNCCQQLINRSIDVCNDVLTPLLISSLKSHRAAYDAFKTEKSKESSATKMAETEEIAKQIAFEYKTLGEEFCQLQENVGKALCSLVGDQFPLWQLRKITKSSDINQLKILTRGIDSSDQAIKAFGKIVVNLSNIYLAWSSAKIHSQSLANSLLANQVILEALGDVSPESSNSVNEFWKQAEKEINLEPSPLPVKNLTDVTMKSGTKTLSDASEKSFVDLIREWIPETSDERFKQSYLKWLALAKVNLEIANAMKNAAAEINQIQIDILQTEKDPLVIALHEAASNS